MAKRYVLSDEAWDVVADLGDINGRGDQKAHFNLRPLNNLRTGQIPGTKDHYYFKEK